MPNLDKRLIVLLKEKQYDPKEARSFLKKPDVGNTHLMNRIPCCFAAGSSF